MNNSGLTLLILILLLQACKEKKDSHIDSLEAAKKVVLKIDHPEEFFYWELNDEERLWAFEKGEVQYLNLYKDSLKLALGNQLYDSAIQKELAQDLAKELITEEKNGDRINALLVHTGSIGKIRKINFLESQMLNYQIGRYPMFSHATEFHGFIVKNKNEGKVRAYFASSNTGWPPKPIVILDELDKLLLKGWQLIGHLHNHYCEENGDYVGVLAPSLADAQYYKSLKEEFGLEKALITNGFHTVEIANADFERFESH